MPIYEYKCKNHGVFDRFVKSYETDLDAMPCKECGESAPRIVSLVASTPGRWGDMTGKYGVDGHYDVGLGKRYHNNVERDKLLKEGGWVPWDDVGGVSAHETYISQEKTRANKEDAYVKAFDAAAADGAGLIKAHEAGESAEDKVS